MARAERALARYAEPFQALYGQAWPDRLLDLAWRRVIENSAHDSICGCSVDEVSTQVLVRCAEAEQIAMGLADEAIRQAAAGAPLGSVVAFNPSPVRRAGLVEVELAVPAEWDEMALELPDGSRIATQEVRRNEPLLFSEWIPGPDVSEWLRRRLHGRQLFARRLNGMEVGERQVTFLVDDEDNPIWLHLEELKHELQLATATDEADWEVRIAARPRRTVVAQVPVPPLGWTAFQPVQGAEGIEDAVRVEQDRLDNGLLSVIVSANGTLTINGDRGGGTPRRRRRRRRQLQLRAAARGCPRRGAGRRAGNGPRRRPRARRTQRRPVVPLVGRRGAGRGRNARRAQGRGAVLPHPGDLRQRLRRSPSSLPRSAPAGHDLVGRRGPVRRRRAWPRSRGRVRRGGATDLPRTRLRRRRGHRRAPRSRPSSTSSSADASCR